jgi:sensor histidine kinase YesM
MNSSSRKQFYILLLAVWSVLATFMTIQMLRTYAQKEIAIAWYIPALMEFSYSFQWVLLAPLALWLVKKLPLDRKRWIWQAPLHIGIGMILSALTMGVRMILRWIFLEPAGSILSFDDIIRNMFSFFDYGMMSYFLILFLSYAHEYRERVHEREQRTLQLETELATSQLSHLKSQLHPHFLFNVLNTISMLVRKKENDTAVNMLAGISDFLRQSLATDTQQKIPLSKELEFARLYLDIQRLRFQDRLQVKFDIAASIEKVLIPPLLLQPLIENALEHGIGADAKSGLIEISASANNGKVKLLINDNGTGTESPEFSPAKKGIGLSNTESRLMKLYGNAARLSIVTEAAKGTTVEISIPIEYE